MSNSDRWLHALLDEPDRLSSGQAVRGACVVDCCCGLSLGTASSPARAENVRSALARAAVLRTQLAELQSQADRSVEQYDLAEGQFGQQVTARVSLEEKAARMAPDAAAKGAVKGARIRALYMAGGGAALYARLLNSDNLADAVHQSTVMQYVFTGHRAGQRTDDAAVGRLAAAQAAAQRATARLALRRRQLAVLADHVQELLDRQRELVAAADTQVLGLVRQQQADAAAAAADKFGADLVAAQAGQAARTSASDAPGPSEVAPPAPGPNPGAARPSDPPKARRLSAAADLQSTSPLFRRASG